MRAVASAGRWLGLLGLVAFQPGAAAQEPALDPAATLPRVVGPAVVDVGNGLARLDLDPATAFVSQEGARQLLESGGNPADGTELGVVVPVVAGPRWIMVVKYRPAGPDEVLDADALLRSSRALTEATNGWRTGQGHSGLHVAGWLEEPRYDAERGNLRWAVVARDDRGRSFANFHLRIAGRHGFLSATLVGEASTVGAWMEAARQVMSRLAFQRGWARADREAGEWASRDDRGGVVSRR